MTIDILGLTCRLALHSFSVLESRLSIVMFHSVLDAPDPLRKDSPGIAEFDAQIRWLSGSFRILPLRQATEKLWAGQLPARALCITFDDGYRDNVLNALPVLLKYQVPATFFVTTRYTHGGMMWNDRVIEAIRGLAAGHHRDGELWVGRRCAGGRPSRCRAEDAWLYQIPALR